MNQITDENRHPETDWGADVGAEVIDAPTVEIVNQVVKIGRDFKVIASVVNGKPKYVTIAAGSVLLKVAAREVYPHYLVIADKSIPAFWIGRHSADTHYESNEPRELIFKQ